MTIVLHMLDESVRYAPLLKVFAECPVRCSCKLKSHAASIAQSRRARKFWQKEYWQCRAESQSQVAGLHCRAPALIRLRRIHKPASSFADRQLSMNQIKNLLHP